MPRELWLEAARNAAEINPANVPGQRILPIGAPVDMTRDERLAVDTTKYWGGKGIWLTVGFMDGPPAALRTKILSHMNAWGEHCHVRFTEAADPYVRIARTVGGPEGGFWSHLGTDITLIASDKPTMNLEGFTMDTPDWEFCQIVRHETGHTLGFPHEHLRPEIVSRIDRAKAIEILGREWRWPPQMVIDNVLTPLDTSALLATAKPDTHSIMCYTLPASVTVDGIAVEGGFDIDPTDAQFAASVYPL
ncbi:MAG TPA: M12 family metallopeptidase [Thermoleophilia bacterium]|nr:M12 family metallopeptidase [Thermoleophilia bacterium]